MIRRYLICAVLSFCALAVISGFPGMFENPGVMVSELEASRVNGGICYVGMVVPDQWVCYGGCEGGGCGCIEFSLVPDQMGYHRSVAQPCTTSWACTDSWTTTNQSCSGGSS